MSRTESSNPSVEALVQRIQAAVDGAEALTICQRVKAVLSEELGNTQVEMPVSYLTPVPDGYARRLLFKDPEERFTIVIMVWAPGQATPLHDHAGHWCVECVYSGRIQVTSYDLMEEGEGDAARFAQQSSIISEVGGAGALIPPFEYHTISNPFDQAAVTMHVYGGEITWCNCFEPLQQTGWYRRHRRELPYSA